MSSKLIQHAKGYTLIPGTIFTSLINFGPSMDK